MDIFHTKQRTTKLLLSTRTLIWRKKKGRKEGKRKEGKKRRKVKDKKGKKRIQSLNVELLDRKQGGKEERKENREEEGKGESEEERERERKKESKKEKKTEWRKEQPERENNLKTILISTKMCTREKSPLKIVRIALFFSFFPSLFFFPSIFFL